MPAKNLDLHGNVPDQSAVALVLIDVINDLEFEGGEALLPHALTMAAPLKALKARAKAAGIPVVYANDNYGRWKSDLRSLIDHALAPEVRGRPLVAELEPDPDDYFVLKPKHSAFYGSSLDVLLNYLGARTLILAGIAGDSCVLFTANDAFLRDFHVVVPADCVASQHEEDNEFALTYLKKVLRADTRPSVEIDFDELKRWGE